MWSIYSLLIFLLPIARAQKAKRFSVCMVVSIRLGMSVDGGVGHPAISMCVPEVEMELLYVVAYSNFTSVRNWTIVHAGISARN